MTTKRSIIFFWVLFLLPTLIMAGAAAKLLSHEQTRINQSARSALTERADAVAQTIHLTVDAIRENLTGALIRIPAPQLMPTLLAWERQNPLVRNVFIFNPDKTLAYPVKGMASTSEERRFMARYDALFSGRTAFEVLEAPRGREAARTVPASLEEIKDSRSSRKELVALSKSVYPAPQATADMEPGAAREQEKSPRSGWLPWFSENRLHVLIWIQKSPQSPVYGMELELMTLLSRLVVDFPEVRADQASLVLVDGSSNAVHQSGNLDLSVHTVPVARIPVSDLLPHWQINVFMDTKGLGAANGFFVLSLVLVGIFITAIVSGGILLTRMTLKNMKDAQQKTSFVSSVSHELKTPLTSIRMYAELLLSGRVKDEVKKGSYLSVIVTESERLTRLINNVLDFGRLEQGKKSYNKAPFELDTFLYQVIDAHKIRIRKQGLEIITAVKEAEFNIRTDRDAIGQVVLNLLDNALKYAGSGKFIKFVLQRETKKTFLLKICDDGPGIPKSEASMIFKKFHRVDNSLTADKPGSGLGLSIARQILRDLGGDLTYEPMQGGGSCFAARIKNHAEH
jgi:signal transduction histidine kinase